MAYKSRGVVICNDFAFTKSLQSWVGLDDMIFQGALGKKLDIYQLTCKIIWMLGLLEAHQVQIMCIVKWVLITFFSWDGSFFPWAAAMLAKYWMTLFVFTVFPAPDSPLENAPVYKFSVTNTLTAS